jgi:hypothetical protein
VTADGPGQVTLVSGRLDRVRRQRAHGDRGRCIEPIVLNDDDRSGLTGQGLRLDAPADSSSRSAPSMPGPTRSNGHPAGDLGRGRGQRGRCGPGWAGPGPQPAGLGIAGFLPRLGLTAAGQEPGRWAFTGRPTNNCATRSATSPGTAGGPTPWAADLYIHAHKPQPRPPVRRAHPGPRLALRDLAVHPPPRPATRQLPRRLAATLEDADLNRPVLHPHVVDGLGCGGRAADDRAVV